MTGDGTGAAARSTPGSATGDAPESATGSPRQTNRTAGSDPVLRRAIARVGTRPTWAVLAVVALPFALGLVGSVPRRVQYVPLVVSAVLFGMPHGAVDHLVPARLSDVALRRSVGAVVAVYAVLGGAYLAWWFVAPVTAAAAFVAITWIHWGQGDVYLLSAATGGTYPRSIPHRTTTLVVRGAMPMAVPLVAFPGEYRRVVADLVGLFGASADPLAAAFAPGTRRVLAAALVGLTAVQLLRGAVRIGRSDGGGDADATADAATPGWITLALDRGLTLDLVDTGLLWAYFLTVPPVLAVGLYFPLWHAWRHVVRLVAGDDRAATALRDGRTGRALAKFSTDAAPLTAVSLATCAGLYLLVPDSPGGLPEVVALYLVMIAVLTLPHLAVVTWMDRREAVW
ncbi:beta-carotene 15,15'-monooxygenase [Halobacteriales archaeon QS_8_69_26]|nr:MAG: beta-carotene 15,15'-monooxygenase [Halobacteriales archaeon QS_8_69_26]